MPLERKGRLTDQSVTMERPEDIELVFDALRRVPSRGFFTKDRAQREVAEEVGYQLLVHPDWIVPHVARRHAPLGGAVRARSRAPCRSRLR